jgi:hypothetical protein
MKSSSFLKSFFNLNVQLVVHALFKTNAILIIGLQIEEFYGEILQLKELY